MSDFGTFCMDRGWFEHPVFQDEPFTEREAWAWMIARASGTDRTRRVGNIAIPVRRSQLAHSGRFFAKRFQWSHSRVQRFLARLVAESMIETVTESGVTCVTICNYDKYQPAALPSGSVSESPPIQTKKESNLTTDSESVVGGETRARDSVISGEAFLLADEVMKTLSISTEFIPPGWCGLPMWLHTGLTSGWRPELVRIAAAKLRARRNYEPPYSFNYLNGPIERAHKEFATPRLPLSPVSVHSVENNHAQPAASLTAATWQQSRDNFRTARADFKAGIEAAKRASDPGSGDGGQVVRLTPAAGRR